jgi:hypothetical protein
VEVLSALVIGAIWVTLSGKGEECLKELKIDHEIYAWGKEFNRILEASSKRIGEESVDDELEKMEASLTDSGGLDFLLKRYNNRFYL